mgnify:CR=1 FL=1
MCLCGYSGILMALTAHVVFGDYYCMSKRQFGGLSGDLAGWFLQTAELWMLLVLSIIGLVLIVWGSDVTVDAATALARYFGMSERFIGLTIVALGTSLPELFSSLTAARKGNADIAIGNIVGSNIFNILFVLGTTALITPVPFAARFTVDTIVAVLVGVLLVCVARSKKLTKPTGILMLAAYAAYFIYLLQV